MKAIAAMDPNRVIGYKGKIPWRLPEDFNWFKKKTLETGKMVMGKNTFQSVGALPNRFTYVLTTDLTLLALPPLAQYRYVTPEFFNNESYDDLWVCGGTQTYQLLLPRCTEVYMTHVIETYEGDTYMPEFEDHFPNQEIIKESRDFLIVKHSR